MQPSNLSKGRLEPRQAAQGINIQACPFAFHGACGNCIFGKHFKLFLFIFLSFGLDGFGTSLSSSDDESLRESAWLATGGDVLDAIFKEFLGEEGRDGGFAGRRRRHKQHAMKFTAEKKRPGALTLTRFTLGSCKILNSISRKLTGLKPTK